MMAAVNRLGSALWFSLLIATGCSADLPQAPTNQLIEGPLSVTTEWQTLILEKPLKTLPHIQRMELLFETDPYGLSDYSNLNDSYIISSAYKHSNKDIFLLPNVILIDKSGSEFKATMKAIGNREIKGENYSFLGYGLNSDKDQAYFSQEIEFVKIKYKANIDFKLSYLYWVAPRYYQAPKDTWKSVNKSKIFHLE